MSPQGLKQELRENPFKPFRMIMTDGKTYDVLHPDFVWVGTHDAKVATLGKVPDGLWERYDTIAVLHINRIEPLPMAEHLSIGASGNGTH